ncbi:MAG: cysteine desulfurase [Phycisphaeraceae bacterium]|nr:cysteine desulfurase [Phycisphaeraceae bacterium]
MIYLDNNATTKPHPEVIAAVTQALTECWHNPSSVHRPGQVARQHVERAREEVATFLNCRPREIIFMSGGTEADNHAIHGSLAAQPDRRVLVTDRLEHSAIRETAMRLEQAGTEVIWLESDRDGVIRVDHVQTVVSSRAEEIALVSVMWANNETGAIQPMPEIAAICREHGVRLHSDGVQAVGKIPVDLARVPVDLLSFAAHKFYGPKGIGGLFVRRGCALGRYLTGGPHERELRAGTENVPGIVGLGTACRLAREWLDSDGPARIGALRDRFERGILARVPGAVINSAGARRMENTSNIAFPRLASEALLLLLSERGLCAAAGAACSTGSLEPSPVLLAMGVDHALAGGSIRFSLSRDTTAPEIDAAIEIVAGVVERLRSTITV